MSPPIQHGGKTKRGRFLGHLVAKDSLWRWGYVLPLGFCFWAVWQGVAYLQEANAQELVLVYAPLSILVFMVPAIAIYWASKREDEKRLFEVVVCANVLVALSALFLGLWKAHLEWGLLAQHLEWLEYFGGFCAVLWLGLTLYLLVRSLVWPFCRWIVFGRRKWGDADTPGTGGVKPLVLPGLFMVIGIVIGFSGNSEGEILPVVISCIFFGGPFLLCMYSRWFASLERFSNFAERLANGIFLAIPIALIPAGGIGLLGFFNTWWGGEAVSWFPIFGTTVGMNLSGAETMLGEFLVFNWYCVVAVATATTFGLVFGMYVVWIVITLAMALVTALLIVCLVFGGLAWLVTGGFRSGGNLSIAALAVNELFYDPLKFCGDLFVLGGRDTVEWSTRRLGRSIEWVGRRIRRTFRRKARLFISYRRYESEQNWTDRIYESLSQQYGRQRIFRDLNTIDLGTDLAQRIEQGIEKCDIFLPVVGKQWFPLREHRDIDWVEQEIATAIAQKKTIIPIIIDGAAMPGVNDLPEEIREVAFALGQRLRAQPDYERDMQDLIDAIDDFMVKVVRERRRQLRLERNEERKQRREARREALQSRAEERKALRQPAILDCVARIRILLRSKSINEDQRLHVLELLDQFRSAELAEEDRDEVYQCLLRIVKELVKPNPLPSRVERNQKIIMEILPSSEEELAALRAADETAMAAAGALDAGASTPEEAASS